MTDSPCDQSCVPPPRPPDPGESELPRLCLHFCGVSPTRTPPSPEGSPTSPSSFRRPLDGLGIGTSCASLRPALPLTGEALAARFEFLSDAFVFRLVPPTRGDSWPVPGGSSVPDPKGNERHETATSSISILRLYAMWRCHRSRDVRCTPRHPGMANTRDMVRRLLISWKTTLNIKLLHGHVLRFPITPRKGAYTAAVAQYSHDILMVYQGWVRWVHTFLYGFLWGKVSCRDSHLLAEAVGASRVGTYSHLQSSCFEL